MIYVALVLALGLACVAGVQFFYLIFLEAGDRQQRKRIAELERENAELARRLESAEASLERELARGREHWPELIEGDYTRS